MRSIPSFSPIGLLHKRAAGEGRRRCAGGLVDRRTVIAGIAAAPLVAATGVTGTSSASAAEFGGHERHRTLVIGHRGASGYRPEHTLASYELAARIGADFMEPDLVPTKDGVLVCRHEPEIGGTTDVADHPEFAARKVTKVLDGTPVTGWFTEDFTLAELKTLRAKERLPAFRQENTMYDGRFEVPTFVELLELRQRLSRELGRELGVYPETKHPTYFQKAGLPLEQRLLDLLNRYGLNHRGAPVFVQSFETGSLRQLRTLGLRAPSVQLLSAGGAPFDLIDAGDPRTYADLSTPAGLRQIASYANGIGPDKTQIIPRAADGTLGTPTSLVPDAHAAGLVLHPYTFRAENNFLPVDYRRGANLSDFGRGIDEQVTYLKAGIDGLFTDQADIGVIARNEAFKS
nr:glycerophosphodiester phosphodiesterase [Frankia sp. Cas3]